MKENKINLLKIPFFIALLAGSGWAFAATVTLVNLSGFDIYNLYLSPSNDENWGPDQLGEWVLEDGQQYTLKMQCGTYDVQLIDEDGDTCTLNELYMCGSEEAVINPEDLLDCQFATELEESGLDDVITDITLANVSGFNIYELYLSPSDSTKWGPDQLGEEVLGNGQQITISAICGDYDLRLIDEDSDTCEIREVYLCGDENVFIDQDDLLACQGY